MTTPLQAQAEISSLLEKLRIGQKYDRASGDPLDMSSTMEEAVDCIENLLSAISAQEAEVGRLRGALERIVRVRYNQDGDSKLEYLLHTLADYRHIARAALTQGETK